MLKRLLVLVALVLGLPGLARAAAILVNEFSAVAATQFLNGGTAAADVDGAPTADTYFGREIGNGGDWLELVVVQDHFDLRGSSLSIAEGTGAGRATTVLTFTQNSLWSDLRSGTIITVAEDVPDDPTYNPLGGDWWLNAQASNTASGLFITASNFSVSNDDTQISILDSLSHVVFGPAGEGVQPTSGVSRPTPAPRSRRSRPTTTAARARSARRTAGTAARTCRTSARCALRCPSPERRRSSVSPWRSRSVRAELDAQLDPLQVGVAHELRVAHEVL